MIEMDRNEEWRAVVGLEGRYSVSSLGNIRRESAASGTSAGKALKPSISKTCPYYRFTPSIGGIRLRDILVHVAVAESFLGGRRRGMVVNHKNGIKTDNTIGNLEVVSKSYDVSHSMRTLGNKKFMPRGENNKKSKLNDRSVREIRRCGDNPKVIAELSVSLGVHISTIYNVLSNKSWRHVV